ncbi:MAG: hypothetical protein LBF04_04910 [Prevotellaceae bacterium]|jgi:hypothetical protein|nr:hypothetical protein [Prevotellaceae bacterium]
MPFISEILKYSSVAIVGTEKNTGKTECLNYILSKLHNMDISVAVTSTGIDGESTDQVTGTAKPEITVFENMIFVTSEKHYHTKLLTAEILDISVERTSLGRLVTAKAKTSGKVLLSGPSNTALLQKIIRHNASSGVDITIVDGALSRMSPASPSVAQSMILATGAAFSANIRQLVQKTKFVCELVSLERADKHAQTILAGIDKGLYSIDENGELHDLNIESAFMLTSTEAAKTEYLRNCKTLFVAGVVSDKLLDFIRMQDNIDGFTLIAKDFTKIFVTPEIYNLFLKKGGCIKVLYKTRLIAITVNPVSPQGYVLDTNTLQQALRQNLNFPVYDLRQLQN